MQGYMLRSAFLMPKVVAKSIHDILKFRLSKYCEVVQENFSGSNSLQLPSNLAQKRSSGEANCRFDCVGAFLNRRLFLSE